MPVFPLPIAEDISTYSDRIKDLHIHPSGKQGLGISLEEEVIQKYLVSSYSI